MTFEMRCQDLFEKDGVYISKYSLARLFRRSGIKKVHLKRDYSAKAKKTELRSQQEDFTRKVLELMSDLNNIVYFFDESSVHAWTTQRFAYMNP